MDDHINGVAHIVQNNSCCTFKTIIKMGIFDSVWVVHKRLYNLDKLYKDMPKLYYNTVEVIEVTKQDILKYINSSRSI